jgi:pimeloyl-ACP methyl ester carboxylesterase
LAVYVSVSYIAALKYVPWRSSRELLRATLRESWVAAWTQPLLLWFQVVGRRMGSGGGAVPVVLVHGYFQNRVDFLYIASRLRKAGSGPLYACNFFWPDSLERSSAAVRSFVERTCAETGASAVDLVTHSTGGLFALDIISEEPHLVRRAALVALPARGVPWKGPVVGRSGSQLRAGSLYTAGRLHTIFGTPVLSIYSAHDNLVHPAETSRLEGPSATNVEVSGPGHLSVLFDERVGDAICDFLLGRRR